MSVNPAGMCCVINIAGLVTGNGSRKLRIASVPPVDAPTAINFSLEIIGVNDNDLEGAACTFVD